MAATHLVAFNHQAALSTARRALSMLMAPLALLVASACHKDATSPPRVVDVTIVLSSGNLAVSQSMQLSGVAKDAGGNPLTATLTWTSSDDRVATVTPGGLVTAIAPGDVDIIATANGITGRGRLLVYAPNVAVRLDVTAPSAALTVGSTMQMDARAYDAIGGLLAGRTVTWSSSATAIATVSETGNVTAIGSGQVTITATVDGKQGYFSIVAYVPDAATRIDVSATDTFLGVGSTAQFTAKAFNALLTVLVGHAVSWSSSAPAVASVSESGLVTALAIGTVTIFAKSDGAVGRSSLTVSVAVRFESLAIGPAHTCGLAADGAAWCWGDNSYGSLGTGSFSSGNRVPTRVVGGVVFGALTAGSSFTCGLTRDGKAWCWGFGEQGQLGAQVSRDCVVNDDYYYGTTASLCSNRPAAVRGDLTFRSLSAGPAHACGVTLIGEAICWGASFGASPARVSVAETLTAVSAGGISCGLGKSGAAYCWGANLLGLSAAPSLVSGDLGFTSLSAGSGHGCGIIASGQAYCWGLNPSGELGAVTSATCLNGQKSIACSPTPVAVSGGRLFASLGVASTASSPVGCQQREMPGAGG